MASINLLLPEQHEQLRALDAALRAATDFESACRQLVARVAAILDSPTAFLDEPSGRWRVVSTAQSVPSSDVLIRMARRLPSLDPALRVADVHIGDAAATVLALNEPGATKRLLWIEGDWTASRLLLHESAAHFTEALNRFGPGRPSFLDRQLAAAFTLPRRLARAEDPSQMHQVIVDTCAVAVGAQKASLALYDPEQRSLSVAATHGYPVVLVRQMRFRPGEGIIGTVFRTGRALRVDDIRRIQGAPPPRLRYRTTSFMSVPLTGTSHVLGVINVSDPRGAERFSRQDLRTLRALASIARLGLDRAKALEQASASAHAAAVDPLTGLFNRRYFLTRLEEEVERARRQSSPLTVMMLDVDDFKQLNDRLGHLVGDAVLRVVGDVLRRSVRLFDVCARHGGDEFAILMPGSSPENSRRIAERIREGVEDSRPSGGPWSDELRLTTSIGLATFANTTAEDLIDRADQALYAAKRQGKNRVRITQGSGSDTSIT
jgi:diguanylate cyclase (GGDEF)-like protein